MNKIQGGCHCGNIKYSAVVTNDIAKYLPVACSCNFCTSHGASYISDSRGSLSINIKNKSNISEYRHGSRIAYFLICKTCGILTNACYEEKGNTFSSINILSLNLNYDFGKAHSANIIDLSDEEKINLWKKYWFNKVAINYEYA
jgi:hypothetical protein